MKTLAAFLSTIKSKLANGETVVIPGVCEFMPVSRELEMDNTDTPIKKMCNGVFRPSTELRQWINGTCKFPYAALDYNSFRITPDDQSATLQLLDVCAQLVSNQIHIFELEGFFLWLGVFPKYEGKNPMNGEAIVIPERKIIVGGYAA